MEVSCKTVFNDELYKRILTPFVITQVVLSAVIGFFLVLSIIFGILVNSIAFISSCFCFIILLVSIILGAKTIKNIRKNMKEKYLDCIIEFNFYYDSFKVFYYLGDSFSSVDYEKNDIASIERKNNLTFITLKNDELLIVDELSTSNKEEYNKILKEYV